MFHIGNPDGKNFVQEHKRSYQNINDSMRIVSLAISSFSHLLYNANKSINNFSILLEKGITYKHR